jgi:hypothetical protein
VEQDEGPNGYGQSVEARDEMIIGQYYKQQRNKHNYFMLEKEKGHDYIYSHHVVASKFLVV